MPAANVSSNAMVAAPSSSATSTGTKTSSNAKTSTRLPSPSIAGQNTFRSGLCIATKSNGDRCPIKVEHPYVPYCKRCMENGDPSLAVVDHPKFGKMLTTKRDLPRGYKMALWGTVYSADDMPEEDKEWGFENADGTFINPVKHPSSQTQFCQCPGPHEKVTVTFNHPHLMMETVEPNEKRKEKYASMLFQTNQPVPKNHQLVMMYESNEKTTEIFFQTRGIERCDVWTKKNPTILKKNASVKDLKLAPSTAPLSKWTHFNMKTVNKSSSSSKMKATSGEGTTSTSSKATSNGGAMSTSNMVKKTKSSMKR